MVFAQWDESYYSWSIYKAKRRTTVDASKWLSKLVETRALPFLSSCRWLLSMKTMHCRLHLPLKGFIVSRNLRETSSEVSTVWGNNIFSLLSCSCRSFNAGGRLSLKEKCKPTLRLTKETLTKSLPGKGEVDLPVSTHIVWENIEWSINQELAMQQLDLGKSSILSYSTYWHDGSIDRIADALLGSSTNNKMICWIASSITTRKPLVTQLPVLLLSFQKHKNLSRLSHNVLLDSRR